MCVCTVYIYYVSINTHECIRCIIYNMNYMHVNIFKIYTVCVFLYIYIIMYIFIIYTKTLILDVINCN